MDKKKAEEAMTKLKIAIRIKKEEIKNNKILFPRHDNSRLEEDIETYETAIEALEKEIIRSHMDDHGGKANEMVGWIPVSKWLPENGTYLCTLDGELCGIDEPFTGMCGIENGKWDEEGCVIAWMLLPEPYKRENMVERREKEMKNIERIKTMSEEELVELFHEIPFNCADQCPDFGYGCLGTCTHDCGREFIRNWLNEEN